MSTCSGNYLQILKDLIRFPTISSDSNLALIEYLDEKLKPISHSSRYFYNAEENKANLLVHIGPDDQGGILLAGHTDVVPVEGQHWSRDPFESYVVDGKIYGRGSCDMKGFIALIVDVVLSIDIKKLKHPIFLLFTYDEEIGCFGAQDIAEPLATLANQVDYAIIGEPTDLQLVTAHKGLQAHRTKFIGKPAHSSCPDLGTSAILSAANFLQQLNTVLPSSQDDNFQPPYSTYNAGMIQGGNALNIIPEHCEILWECRILPQFTNEQIVDNLSSIMMQIENETGVKVSNDILSFVPGLKDDMNLHVVKALLPLLPKDTPVSTVSFVTEAGILQQAGIPTIVFGPGHINQAHKPNEYVSVKAMEDYRLFLQKLLKKHCCD